MPKKTSRTIYAVLGLLEKGPKTGYDLKKTLEQTRYKFWNESYGQIYPTLRKLLAKEWVTMNIEEKDDGPDRKVYEITEEGSAELERWLRQPASDFSIRDEIALRMDLGRSANPAILQGMLEALVDECDSQLNSLAAELEEAGDEVDDFEQMSSNWTRSYLETRKAWARQCIEELIAKQV